MADDIADVVTLAELEALIDAWLAEQLDENPVVAAVERGEPSERRWYVRVHGESKDVFTIWFTLRQRSLPSLPPRPQSRLNPLDRGRRQCCRAPSLAGP